MFPFRADQIKNQTVRMVPGKCLYNVANGDADRPEIHSDRKFLAVNPDSKSAAISESSEPLLTLNQPYPPPAGAMAYWLGCNPLLRLPQTQQSRSGSMAFKDVLSLCGRIGLIVAAFAFVAGIVAGPLLEKVWSSRLTVTEQSSQPELLSPKALSEQPSGKQG